MEQIKDKVTDLVKEFATSVDEDIEMLDTNGVVLKFASNAPVETVQWICKLIEKPVLSGGAELSLKHYEVDGDEDSQIFIISANSTQLVKAADQFNLMKQTHEGIIKAFRHEERFDFENFEENNVDFFSCSEQQYLIKCMLNNVISDDEEIKHVPGYPKVKVYKSRPVIPRCRAKKIIDVYPLHDLDNLKGLKNKWYSDYTKFTQPLEEIKKYFGESITLYFSFLEYYTKYLIPPAIVGFFHSWFFVWDSTDTDNILFAVMNVIWATVFLELWKRKGASIVHSWGRLDTHTETSTILEKPRAEYKGHPRVSPITGLLEPYYPTWRRRLKMYLVTYPVLVLSLLFAAIGMWFYFEFKEKLMAWNKGSSGGLLNKMLMKIPGVVYASIIFGLNNLYGKLAVIMNDWENHRIQSSYNNHLIVKLVLFYFVNSFLSLFYIAFYLQDMAMLKQHLATLLITQQIIQQVQESVFPYMKFKRHNIKVEKTSVGLVKFKKIRDPKNQVSREGNLPEYSTTFQDYLELFLQFGYVFLFSAVYPLAAFWAVLNNLVEMKTDAFKLCNLHQRPFIQPASSIGAWQIAFEVMSIIAVMTNCALIAMSPSIRSWLSMETNPIHYVICFVAIEHVVILVKIAITYMIPDIPGDIKKVIAKQQYQRNQRIKEKELQELYKRQRLTSE
eukprot:TCONS_00066722-protein